MLSVRVQKDIGEYTEKIVGKLSARTLVCLAGGLASAVGTAAICQFMLGIEVRNAALPVMCASMPFWLAGFWRPYHMKLGEVSSRFGSTSSSRTRGSSTARPPCSRASARSCAGGIRRARRGGRRRGRGPSSMILPGKGKKESPTGKAEPRKGSWRAHGAHVRSAGLEEEEKRVEQAARRKRRARAEAKRRALGNRLRRNVRRRDRAGRGRAVQPDHRVRRHQLPAAREENQQSVFAAMSELYDYFGSETSVQLTIINTPHPPSERSAQALLREERPARRQIRRGVQPHPQRQDARGGVQPRAPPIPHLPRGSGRRRCGCAQLARARSDCMQTLARIRCESRTLDGQQRLALLQSQLRPGSEPSFSWDKLSHESGLRTKDLVAPSVLDFKPEGRADCYRADDAWCRVLVFRGFGSDLEDDCIANVVDLPMPLNVTLHVHPMGKGGSRRLREKSASPGWTKRSSTSR